jgi:branched-chain amino acid transport system substrate-binding protein
MAWHSLKDFALPTFLDGVKINTGPTNSQVITQLKLRRWSGKSREEFGEIVNNQTNW